MIIYTSYSKSLVSELIIRVYAGRKMNIQSFPDQAPNRYLLVQSQQWKHQSNLWNLFKVNNKATERRQWSRSGVLIVNFEEISLHTIFQCFYCWLWANKCRLGSNTLNNLWRPETGLNDCFKVLERKEEKLVMRHWKVTRKIVVHKYFIGVYWHYELRVRDIGLLSRGY